MRLLISIALSAIFTKVACSIRLPTALLRNGSQLHTKKRKNHQQEIRNFWKERRYKHRLTMRSSPFFERRGRGRLVNGKNGYDKKKCRTAHRHIAFITASRCRKRLGYSVKNQHFDCIKGSSRCRTQPILDNGHPKFCWL